MFDHGRFAFETTSIRAKLGVIFISFLLLVGASAAATGVSIRTQAADAVVINLAGRQRMLTQRLTKAALGIAAGTAGYQAELAETVQQFDATLAGLLDGGAVVYADQQVTLPSTTDPLVRAELAEVSSLWQQLQRDAGIVQTSEPSSPASIQAVRGIEAISLVILGEMDEVVRLYETAAEQKVARLRAIQLLFFVGAVGLVILGYRLTQRTIVRPASTLEFATQRIAAGDLQTPIEARPGASGELASLGRALEDMRHQLLTSRMDLQRSADHLRQDHDELAQAYRELQNAQEAVLEKQRLDHELNLARELQQSLLPRSCPLLPGFRCAARSEPARPIGGDFYDMIPLGDGKVGLVMADVSDKGMAAALYMALTRSLIHVEAKHSSSPRKVLLRVNSVLREISHSEMFVTAFYGVFDTTQGTLRYARAGHDYPIISRPGDGECRLLKTKGTMLGIMDRIKLQEDEVQLHPGDLVVLYSDGITEAQSPEGDFYGLDRLCETLRTSDGLTSQELLDRVFERVNNFQAGAEQHDDMTLLVLKVEA